jgi:radical SAM-linked protein
LTPVNEKLLVPLVKIVHDRLDIEVARGCTRGCRFCQAGTVYRPVRERSPEKILQLTEKGMVGGGFEELALLSLSTGDYSCLSNVLGRLMDRFVQDYVSISMPSMRVGTLTPEIMQQIKRVRKTGFTLAPEAGTDRLRRIINKGITEEDLLQTCRDATTLGWKLLKFYFMLGLPGETGEDVRGIAELVRRAGATSQERRLRINISVAAFIPKPHTPFQWEPQIFMDETFAKLDLLKKSLPRGNYRLKWHDPHQSFLEGVMSRGDRSLAGVIEEAWRFGARLDAWSEHFDLSTWEAAARAANIDLAHYLRRRELSEVLPWDHLDTGVTREFLRAELDKSRTGIYTPDCRVHSCQKCGVCDFKTVQPVVQKAESEEDESQEAEAVRRPAAGREERKAAGKSGQQDAKDSWYRVFYAKQGDIRFLSHLEMIQVFFQALRRAGIRLHYSQGFNPVPKASFCAALPVGTESLAEYLDIDLTEPVTDEAAFIRRLNEQLPRGINVLALAVVPERKSKTPPNNLSCFTVSLTQHLTPGQKESLAAFLAQDTFSVSRSRKGRQTMLDIRKQVRSLVLRDEKSLEMHLLIQEGTAAAKPLEILRAVFGFSESQCLDLGILKVWSRVVE